MLKKIINECQKRKSSLKEKGVMFYGILASEITEKIKHVKDKSKEVRLADPLWGGEIESLMEESYIIHPIPIPILPE